MADEPNPTLVTPPNPSQGNDQTARNPDGTIKDQQATPPVDPKSTATPEKSPTTDPAKDGTLATKPDGAKPEAKPEPAVVPEKYEFKAAEGNVLDQALIDKATPVLKELGITQEGAQKLFDIVQDKVTSATNELTEKYQELRDGWRKEIVSDKALGDGKSDLAPETRQNITATINALPEELQAPFRDAMNLTGAGDHPAFVRAMNFLGAAYREGKLVPAGKPSPLGQKAPGAGPKSAASAMYPNLPSSSNG